jgi:predicted site-specific integrase-resolvase
MPKKERKMLSVKEAADILGVPPVSVRLWARRGRLPGAELKESEFGVPYWRIPEDALQGFEKERPGPKPGTKLKSDKGK